jgi:hypothetical protein
MWLKEFLRPWFLIGLLACFIAAVFMSIILRGTLVWEQKLRAEGYPLTMQELEDSYTDVPREENAALRYLKAWRNMQFLTPRENELLPLAGSEKLPEPGQPYPEKTRRIIERYVSLNRPALELIYRAMHYERCRFPVIYSFPANFSHLANMRHLSRLLALETIYHALNREPEKAIDAVAAHNHMIRMQEYEPTLIAQLVRIAIQNIRDTSVKQLLNRAALSDAQLERLAGLYGVPEDPPAWMLRGVQGETGFAMSHEDERLLNYSASLSLSDSLFMLFNRLSGHDFFQSLYKTHQLRQSAELFRIPVSAALQSEKTVAAPGLSQFTESPFEWFNDSSGRIIESVAKSLTDQNLVRTAIALERYRRAKGRYPYRMLEALTPEFLDEVPRDCFSGEALKYRRAEEGCLVYSIGIDRKDDGGKTGEHRWSYDRVVRLTGTAKQR